MAAARMAAPPAPQSRLAGGSRQIPDRFRSGTSGAGALHLVVDEEQNTDDQKERELEEATIQPRRGRGGFRARFLAASSAAREAVRPWLAVFKKQPPIRPAQKL